MRNSTTIRIDREVHEQLKRMARERGITVTETVSQAMLALRQDEIGRHLAANLEADERAWLDADLG